MLQPQRQNDLDVPANEDGDEDISGTQFVCETVIRSLTLEEEPERKPQRRARPKPNLSRTDSELPFVAFKYSCICLYYIFIQALFILQFMTLLAFRKDCYW